MVISTMTSSDSSGRVPLDFDSRLIPRVAVDVGHGPPEVSLVPPSPVPAFRPPYAEEFFEGAFPDSSPLPWPSPGLNGSALPWPLRVNITTLQGSLHVTDYWGARLSQEDTPLQHLWSPRALGACDVALWRLPRPDLHRLADGDLSRHTRPGLGTGAHCCCRLNPGKLLFQPPLNMPHVIRLLHAQPQSWPVTSQLPKPQRHFSGNRMCTG